MDLWAELKSAARDPALVCEAGGFSQQASRINGLVGLLSVNISGQYWQPGTVGDPLAMILPVLTAPWGDDELELVDLVAFRLSNPSGFRVRTGFGKVLGAWNVADVRAAVQIWKVPGQAASPGLELHRTPLDWLQANCEGACIIHPFWASYAMAGVEHLLCQDAAHARQVNEHFKIPAAPQLHVRR
jgi:hypothetical protein